MPAQVTKLLVSAASGGFVAAMLWWVLNGTLPGNGLGRLEQAFWPLNNVYLCAGCGAALAVLTSQFSGHRSRVRQQQLEAAAGLAGFTFRPDVRRSQLDISGHLHVFDKWRSGNNLLTGSIDEAQLQIFDLTTVHTSRSGASEERPSHTYRQHQTVALVQLPPDLSCSVQINCRNRLSWLAEALGFRSLQFQVDDRLTTFADQQAITEFNRKYFVAMGSPGGRVSDGEPDRLQQVIGLPFLKYLAQGRGWNVELCPSHLAVWQTKTRLPPDQLSQWLAEITELYRALVDGAAAGPPLTVTGIDISGEAGTVGARQLGVIGASGCLGMFLAFATFLPVMFLLVEDFPWLIFVWPIYGLAAAVGSAFLGHRLINRR